jgi:hypothetical protein
MKPPTGLAQVGDSSEGVRARSKRATSIFRTFRCPPAPKETMDATPASTVRCMYVRRKNHQLPKQTQERETWVFPGCRWLGLKAKFWPVPLRRGVIQSTNFLLPFLWSHSWQYSIRGEATSRRTKRTADRMTGWAAGVLFWELRVSPARHVSS